MTPLYPLAKANTLLAEGPGGKAESGDAGLLTVFGITKGYDASWPGWPYAEGLISKGVLPSHFDTDDTLMGFVDQFYLIQWAQARMDLFSDQTLASSYFGGYVNEGPKVAHFLQEVAGVTQDGLLGADTMNAVLAHGVALTLAQFKLARVYYYGATANLADLRGLIARVKMGA